MKGGWEIKKLGDVVENIQKGTPISEIIYYDISSLDYKLKKIVSPKLLSPEEIPGRARQFVKSDDLLISTVRPNLNAIALIEPSEKCQVASTGFCVLRSKEMISFSKYFYYYFMQKKIIDYLSEIGENSGASYPAITTNDILNLSIPLPPLSEQKKIVAALDELFSKIDKAKANIERNLANVDEIFQSKINEIFLKSGNEWDEYPFEEYVNFIDYRGRTPEKTPSGVRLITAKNVKMGYLQKEPEEFIASDNYESWMTRGIPNYGDVIFTTEAPLGNVAQITTHEKLAFAQRIIVMQPKPDKIRQDFLKYTLLSPVIRKRIFDEESGATVTGIKAKLLKKILIPVPLLDEQKDVVDVLDKCVLNCKQIKENYTSRLASLDELKKSLLDKAFRGELV